MVKAFSRWNKRSEEKSFGPLRPDLLIIFTEVNQTIRESILFAMGIDNDQRRVFLIPLAGDPIAPVLVRVVALNKSNRRYLTFFHDGWRYLHPAVVA